MLNWLPGNRLDSVLDLCVDQLDHDTPEGVLRRYPQSAPQLAPLLHMAAAIRFMGELRLSPAAHQRHRQRLRQAVLARQRRRAVLGPRKLLRTVAWAALLMMVTGMGLSGVTAASASALPADSLYPWKRASEDVWMSVQRAPEDAATVALWLADRRAAEFEQLYQQEGRVDAFLAAEMRYEYQRTLAYIGAAAPDAAQELLDELHKLGAEHSARFTALAEAARGNAKQRLQATAAISTWAQSVTPDQPTPPALDQMTTPNAAKGAQPPSVAPTNSGAPQPAAPGKTKPATPDNAAQPAAPGQNKSETSGKAAQPNPPGQAKRATPAEGKAAQPVPPGQAKPETPANDKAAQPDPPGKTKDAAEGKAAQPVPPGHDKAQPNAVAQPKHDGDKGNGGGNGKKP